MTPVLTLETGKSSSTAPRPLTLEHGDVHVWRAALDLPGVRVQALREALTPDELARARRYCSNRNRDRFIVARGLLRTILAHYLDALPCRLRFRYGPNGKPALDCEVGGDIQFNLSHADDTVIYAIARRRALGIDLERIRPHSIHARIAERWFSPQENAALLAFPLHEQQRAFFRLWTQKEAFMKALGEGLSFLINPLHVPPAQGEPMAPRHPGHAGRCASQWSGIELAPGPDYVAALVVEGRGWRHTFGQWPPPGIEA